MLAPVHQLALALLDLVVAPLLDEANISKQNEEGVHGSIQSPEETERPNVAGTCQHRAVPRTEVFRPQVNIPGPPPIADARRIDASTMHAAASSATKHVLRARVPPNQLHHPDEARRRSNRSSNSALPHRGEAR
eukprot:2696022-Pleurochrysis_carterae.AAC.1